MTNSTVAALSGSRKAGNHSSFSFGVLSSAAPHCRPRSRKEVKHVQTFFGKLFVALNSPREEGQTMAEYGVILAVITVAVLFALTALSTNIEAAVSRVAAAIK